MVIKYVDNLKGYYETFMNFEKFRELTNQYNIKNAVAQGFFNGDHKRVKFRENHFDDFVAEAKKVGYVKSPLCKQMMEIYKRHLTDAAYKEVIEYKKELDIIKTELKNLFGENYQDLYSFKYSTLFKDVAKNDLGCGEVKIEISDACAGKYNYGNLTLNKNNAVLKWELNAYLQFESEKSYKKLLQEEQFDKITIRIPVLYKVSDDGIWTSVNQMNYEFYWSPMFKLFELDHQDEFKVDN